MKKIALVFVLLLSFPLFTGMTVVYEKSTGKIKAIGSILDYKPQENEGVASVASAKPDDVENHIFKRGEFRQKNKSEIDAEASAIEKAETEKKSVLSSAIKKLKTVVGLSDEELLAIGVKEQESK